MDFMTIFVALNNKRKDTTMARPIKETPILVGTDAERLKEDYPEAKVVGHRDLPGVKKDCPCFEV